MKTAIKTIVENKSNFDGFIVITKDYTNNRYMTYHRDNPQLYPSIKAAQSFINISIQIFLDQVNLDDDEITAYSKGNAVYSKLDDSVMFEYNIINIKGMYVDPDKENTDDDTDDTKNTGCFYKYRVYITYKRSKFLRTAKRKTVYYDVWARSEDDAKTKASRDFLVEYGCFRNKYSDFYFTHTPEIITT